MSIVELSNDAQFLEQYHDSDLSNLGAHEPYEWAEGELEQGKPVKYILDQGLVIEE